MIYLEVFGEQTAEILFEIVTECMDDYLYIFDLQDNTFEISQSAVNRFNMSESCSDRCCKMKL